MGHGPSDGRHVPDPTPPGERPGEATRAALRRAAVAAIADEGWQAAGARSVARRAGVPLGALNYHFAGKEDLFRQAALAEVGRMFATPGRIMAESPTVADLVAGMLEWSRSDEVTPQQQVLLLEVMAQSRRDPELGRLLGDALGGYRSALAAALHRVGADGREELASALAAHCDGLWLHAVIEPRFPSDPAGREATATWLARLAS